MRLRPTVGARASVREAGVSLTELILAVALLGTATVTIMGAFGTLVKTSDLTRKTGDAGATLAAVADAVADEVRNPYDLTCRLIPGSTIYDPTAGVTLPSTLAGGVTITAVRYWNGTAFDSNPDTAAGRDRACRDDTSQTLRLQLVEVRVRSADGRVDRRVRVVKRG